MYYKLLNKNLITAALISLMTLSAAKVCDAQGVVSLVEDENVAEPENNTLPEAAPSADLTLDTEVPNVLPESDDIIPLDNAGLISPAPVHTPQTSSTEQTGGNTPTQSTNDAAPATRAEGMVNPAKGSELPAESFNEDTDFSLGIEAPVPAPATAAKPVAAEANPLFAVPAEKVKTPQETDQFGNSVLSKIDNNLFSQMSDIEKQTTLLTLELRREKIRNEIEAIKAQRAKAEEEKLAAAEEKKRKDIEWQKEQEAKVLREQQILKDKEIELEKLKQKKVLNAYMNKMLEQNQKWISDNAAVYKQMRQVEEDRKTLADNFKSKMESLMSLSSKTVQAANNAKSNHDRTLASLTAQNIQLKKRIDADAIAAKNRQQNPFATSTQTSSGEISTSIDSKIVPINISKEYAIMDITGKGNELVAKLINKEGDSFLARKGTVLQTGHAVEEITPTYIQFDRNGLKDYLYTTGSAMSMEPDKMEGTSVLTDKNKKSAPAPRPQKSGISGERSIPSLGSGMFVK